MATHSSDLAWKVSWTVHRVAESDMTEATEHALTHVCLQYKIQKYIVYRIVIFLAYCLFIIWMKALQKRI